MNSPALRFSTFSTLDSYMSFSGRLHPVSLQCVLSGLYIEQSGLLMLESVFCDGETYYPEEFNRLELERFMDELTEYIANETF